MEIRLLYESEIPQAANVVRGIFDHSVRAAITDPMTVHFSEEYFSLTNLTTMFQQTKLFLWGAFDMGQLVGVGGMQRGGHITILYVFPYYQKRGIGRMLLNEMKRFAELSLGQNRITVNAMPRASESFFAENGFRVMNQEQNQKTDFLPMTADLQILSTPYPPVENTVTYTVRHISEGKVLGVVFGFLVLIVIIAILSVMGPFGSL